MRKAAGLRLSKKWHCHFFEKASLRSAPLLSADSGQFDAHSAQSVFCHAHVAAENKLYCFRVCGRETLRGFFDKLCGGLFHSDSPPRLISPYFTSAMSAASSSAVRPLSTLTEKEYPPSAHTAVIIFPPSPFTVTACPPISCAEVSL